MTTQQSTESHPDAPNRAMHLDGLTHVFGTSGMKTAGGRQQWRNPPLVETQETHYCPLHRWNTFCTSEESSSKGAARTVRRGLNTIDQRASSLDSWSLTDSLSLRLIRFRNTDLPRARGTVNPTFGPSFSALARQKATKHRPEIRKPSEYTLRKSLDRNIRDPLENGNLSVPSDLLGVTDGSFVADGELVATFGPATRQYCLTILGLHTRSEPVGLGPLTVVRLKCTFWHLYFPWRRADDPLRSATLAQQFGEIPKKQV